MHRELKPSNVMVGKYGETLVVDWGLAKATGLPGPDEFGLPPESAMLAATSGSSPETLPGSVIGTPGYMSPAQAAGRLDLLGPASDVYSLGATLYTLLAGRGAFSGGDARELIRKIERGDFPWPRESSPWLGPALEAVCLKAMALRPVDRYPFPRDLAGDVERRMADEPVTAYREPWTRRARRWTGKHRTSLTTAAAAPTASDRDRDPARIAVVPPFREAPSLAGTGWSGPALSDVSRLSLRASFSSSMCGHAPARRPSR